MNPDELKAKSAKDVADNRKVLLAQREAAGQVTLKCKCGAESVVDAKRPAKGPAPKCGACGVTFE